MGFTRPWGRRALALVVAPAIVTSALAGAQAAFADPSNPTPVSATALPTAQVNGVVWAQAVSNGVDFVGGRFTESRPAGSAPGVNAVPRSNLFAFDISSGDAVSFSASTNAQVRTIAASADGSRIYIGGDFTVVNGQPRNHLAVLDRSGSLVSGFAPNINGEVLSVVTRGDVVYVSGGFTAVGSEARARVAAFSIDGTLLPFAPNVGNFTVRALSLSPDGTELLLAGSFTLVNDVNHYGLAAVNSVTGNSLPWATESVIRASGVNAAIYSLSTRGNAVYATGYNYGGDGNLEGSVSMAWNGGATNWIEDCHGDTYSSVPFNDALYIAGHPHYCVNIGGFGEMSPGAQRALGFSQAATHTLLHNTKQGPGYYADFGGSPAPTLLNWYPTLSTGTFTGSYQAAWSVTAGGSYLIYGGEFPKVNGVAQSGLVRFQGQPEAPDGSVEAPPVTTPTPTPTPTPTGTPTTGTGAPGSAGGTVAAKASAPRSLRATALGTASIAVKWDAPKVLAKTTQSYIATASKGGKVVVSVKVSSKKRLAVIGHLARATRYRVTVKAVATAGSSATAKALVIRTKRSGRTVSATASPRKLHAPRVKEVSSHGARIVWSAASASGRTPVSGYQVRIYSGKKLVESASAGGDSRSKTVKGLKSGVAYTVTVRAKNFAGWGSASARHALHTKR